MPELVMPSLGADMDSGKLVEWRIGPGDTIAKGDIIAVVETQKAAMEIESFASGVVDELLITPGSEVSVGTAIARYHIKNASSASVTRRKKDEHVRMSPAARQRARELDIDAHELAGSGPNGVIVLRDVVSAAQSHQGSNSGDRAAAETAPAAAVTEETSAEGGQGARGLAVPSALSPVSTTPLRAAIGAAMSRSKREIPHYYLSQTISMKRALDWLSTENHKRPVTERVLPAAVLLKAVAAALWDVPELNGVWVDGQLMQSQAVHLGTAVALRGGGVIAPAIPDAEQKSVEELMVDLRNIVHRARAGALKQSELTGGTVTVTNVGDRGSEVVYGVINPPQVAIVGIGAVCERPWVEDGEVVVHSVVTATLSADHRATDGHRGGLFLAALDRRLQQPEKL